jgi:hypothetical protein
MDETELTSFADMNFPLDDDRNASAQPTLIVAGWKQRTDRFGAGAHSRPGEFDDEPRTNEARECRDRKGSSR